MIVLADENVHTLISDRSAANGHEVAHIFDLARGFTDEEVLALAGARGALPITNDLDFGELVYRRGSRHDGQLGGVGRGQSPILAGGRLRHRPGAHRLRERRRRDRGHHE